MFGQIGFRELIILMAVIGVLSMTGLWPRIVRGLRELRGDAPPADDKDIDLCYRLLGLSPSASWKDIERAYRAKAKLHHPDHGGDDDTMRALNEAYATLKRRHRG